jgi:hypothetical protein
MSWGRLENSQRGPTLHGGGEPKTARATRCRQDQIWNGIVKPRYPVCQ